MYIISSVAYASGDEMQALLTAALEPIRKQLISAGFISGHALATSTGQPAAV